MLTQALAAAQAVASGKNATAVSVAYAAAFEDACRQSYPMCLAPLLVPSPAANMGIITSVSIALAQAYAGGSCDGVSKVTFLVWIYADLHEYILLEFA